MVSLVRAFSYAVLASLFVAQASAARIPLDSQGHPVGYQYCELMKGQKVTFVNKTNSGRATGLNMQTFNDVIRVANQVYKPIFQQQYGLWLQITGKWSSTVENAFAYPGKDPAAIFEQKAQNGATLSDFDMRYRRVDIEGALARNPYMTADALLMVVCHELGHHIGGLPAKPGGFAANEGQSDYFASSKCMRKILSNYDNVAVMKTREIDPLVRRACLAQFPRNNQAVALCMRSSMAGQQLARVLASFRGLPDVHFNTPARTAATVTDNEHPEAQCRLDTYFQGALCQVSMDDKMTFLNIRTGACVPGRAVGGLSGIGVRPACWFHPKLWDHPEYVTRVPVK